MLVQETVVAAGDGAEESMSRSGYSQSVRSFGAEDSLSRSGGNSRSATHSHTFGAEESLARSAFHSQSNRSQRSWYSSTASEGPLRDALPEELLRGVPLHNLLWGLGEVIRVNPDTLTEDKAAKRYHYSRPVSRLNHFLSHGWASPGWHKHIALLLHFIGEWAFAIGGVAAIGVLCVQRYCIELPYISTVHSEWFNLTWKVSLWEMGVGLIVFVGILLHGHLFLRRTHAFLDCACIHQTNEKKKMAGIRNLSSYLKKSEELIVLWDPIYFTRGWCGYELASYLALNPRGRVRVLALTSFVHVLLIILCFSVGLLSFLLVWPYIPGFKGFNFSCGISAVIMGPAMAYFGEGFATDLAMLKQQLDSFDIRHAQVTEEADRDRIMEHISSMYPRGGADAFNGEVRTTVKNLVVREVGTQRSPISYRMALLACYPAMLFMLSLFSGMRHASLTFQLCVLIYVITFCFFAWPSLLAFLMMLGLRCAKNDNTMLSWRHIGVGCLMSPLTIIGIDLQFYVPCSIAAGTFPSLDLDPWAAPLVGAFFSALWLLFTLFLFTPRGILRDTYRGVGQFISKYRASGIGDSDESEAEIGDVEHPELESLTSETTRTLGLS